MTRQALLMLALTPVALSCGREEVEPSGAALAAESQGDAAQIPIEEDYELHAEKNIGTSNAESEALQLEKEIAH